MWGESGECGRLCGGGEGGEEEGGYCALYVLSRPCPLTFNPTAAAGPRAHVFTPPSLSTPSMLMLLLQGQGRRDRDEAEAAA